MPVRRILERQQRRPPCPKRCDNLGGGSLNPVSLMSRLRGNARHGFSIGLCCDDTGFRIAAPCLAAWEFEMRVAIEAEDPRTERSLFRLVVNSATVGEQLTGDEIHLLVGSLLERTALPRTAAQQEALRADPFE